MAYPLPLPSPNTVESVVTYTYNCLFAYPLWRLYYRWYWKSRDPEDICTALTTSPAEFWRKSSDTRAECSNLIGRDFQGWLAMEEFIILNALMLCILLTSCRLAYKFFKLA